MLVVVVSKTFTTQETLANAELGPGLAGDGPAGGGPRGGTWSGVTPPPPGHTGLLSAFSAAAAPHFSASATGSAAVIRCGRRSACRWRSVARGPEAFDGLLAGARAMDAHFRPRRSSGTPP